MRIGKNNPPECLDIEIAQMLGRCLFCEYGNFRIAQIDSYYIYKLWAECVNFFPLGFAYRMFSRFWRAVRYAVEGKFVGNVRVYVDIFRFARFLEIRRKRVGF